MAELTATACVQMAAGVRRVALSAEQQTALWRRFATRFGVQAFRMAAHGMVPLS
jgi:hypothetical protein